MTAVTHLPTPDQLATVTLLKTPPVSIPRDWRVDPGAIDNDAFERCLCDREAWATVYGLPGPQGSADGACLPCAMWLIELHHTDRDWSGDMISVDVLREPTESRAMTE